MSGIIPRSFIDELLVRTNLVELIDSFVPLKKQGVRFVACCPFHNEKTPSFNVNAQKQFYHCFGCGVSGNAISFAMEYLHKPFPEAIELLASRVGLEVPHDGKPRKQPTENLYQLLSKVAEFYQVQLKNHGAEAIRYLENRGVHPSVQQRFQLGYAPENWHMLEHNFKAQIKDLVTTGMIIAREDDKTYDRYRHRIMYPIHDRYGRIIGFGGRAIAPDQKPKYLNSPETALFQKSRELYGLYQIIHDNSAPESIIIVEGYMDVIALAQFGIMNAVATLGTATSPFHIQSLGKFCKKLIFCFDGDLAGQQAAWRALENTLPYLHNGIDARFVFLPQEHDPDSLIRTEGVEAFLSRIASATPLHQLLFTTLRENIDTTNLAGKSQLIQKIAPYLLKIQDGPYKALILDELAKQTRMESHRLGQFTTEPLKEPSTKTNRINRTPLRTALALLLQHPELYKNNIPAIPLATIECLPDSVLKTLLLQLAAYPDTTTGALLEMYRDTQEFAAITRLTAWDHQVPDEALTKEFIDTLQFLTKQRLEENIAQLLTKAKNKGLTDDERQQLQALLQQKHPLPTNQT